MNVYFYSSSTTPQFSDKLFEGQRNVALPNGLTKAVVVVSPPESLYEAIEGNPAPGPGAYWRIDPASPVLSFEGTEFQASGRVRETNTWNRISVGDLYDEKVREISAEDTRVRYNAFDTSLAANWWVVLTERARSELLTIATGSNSRQINSQPWPGGTNQPRIGVFNAVNGQVRREAIPDQASWDTIETEWYQHDQQVGNATKASGDALDVLNADAQAALDAAGGNESDPAYIAAWDAMAAHDAADPAWGYPPTVEFNQQARALFGG